MSVYLRGTEMPKSCSTCFIAWCVGRANNPQVMVQRGADCPLIPVPDHGRLIDADALSEEHRVRACQGISENSYSLHTIARAWVNDAPTIIPGEEGEG